METRDVDIKKKFESRGLNGNKTRLYESLYENIIFREIDQKPLLFK